jgi:hypothetical protein
VTSTPRIVSVTVKQTVAATPSALQSSGAFVSQGGTALIPGLPALSASSSGGSLATGTVYVKLTYVTPAGETPASRESSVSVTGPTGEVTVTGPASNVALTGNNAPTGYNVYSASASGGEVKQNTTPIAIGTNYIITSLMTGTSSPPTTPIGYSLITQLSDLTALLAPPLNLSSLTWSSGAVTATAQAPLDMTTSDVFYTTIAGATPAGYNGTYIATVTGANTFTFALAANPGSETAPGTYTPRNSTELTSMATTFFAQGNTQAAYVLELGAVEPAGGITALEAFITASPSVFYAYLCPRGWDGQSTLPAFLEDYDGTEAKTYFFVTTTTANLANYTAQMKDVFAFVPSPTAPITEFGCAGPFQSILSNAPSAVNQVPPTAFRYMAGVTPWPTQGYSTTIDAILASNGNVILTGAEGGISNATLFEGTTADGNDFSYWYSVDWVQIQAEQALANAIINGSNNPQNPLYYNQAGINQLRSVAQNVMNSGVAFGLVLPPVTVVATPFYTYTLENPNDYSAGRYNGLAVTYTPQLGFKSITFNVQVSGFVQQPTSQGG